jgi:hypothetical protein
MEDEVVCSFLLIHETCQIATHVCQRFHASQTQLHHLVALLLVADVETTLFLSRKLLGLRLRLVRFESSKVVLGVGGEWLRIGPECEEVIGDEGDWYLIE